MSFHSNCHNEYFDFGDDEFDDDEQNKGIMDMMIERIHYDYGRLVGLDPGLRAIFVGITIEAMDNFLAKNQQERFKFYSHLHHWLTHFRNHE